MDYLALLGTGIIGLIGLALRNLKRRYQVARQQERDRQYAAGLAAGQVESSRMAYAQGHSDGLAEGRAQAGREQTISAEKAFERGYERGQLDLLATFEQADHLRDERPAIAA